MKKINSNITFAEIIKNVPNIEVLKIFDKWLKINEETWLEDLYKYKECKNFRELFIHLNNIEFNIETLKKFVETKSVNNVIIKIRYKEIENENAFHRFDNRMRDHFIVVDYPDTEKRPYIDIKLDEICDYRRFPIYSLPHPETRQCIRHF